MSVIIESGFAGVDVDLNHPRIGYQRLTGTVATSNAAAAGFNGNNAATPQTYTAWQALAVPALWELSFASTSAVAYVGIAVHNAGTVGATIKLRKKIGAVWSDWGGGTTISPTTNDAIMFIVEPALVDGIGIEVSGAIARIGTIAAGDIMEWPRKAVWTGVPISESAMHRYATNDSDTGNWLGRTRIASGLSFPFIVNNLSETFRTGDFRVFRDYSNEGAATFFIAPRPLSYPDDVAYAWSPETIMMPRETPNKAVSGTVSLDLVGYKAP